MTGSKAERGEREIERELGRERDNGSGGRKRRGSFEKMASVDLTTGLNQHLGIFGDVDQ
jgi:hypothetical protein